MRILITSGGTLVPVDPVRSITNSSTGRFGSTLAAAALQADMEVIYLTSKLGQAPFSRQLDLYQAADWQKTQASLEQFHLFCETYRPHYQEYRYSDFADYAEQLQKLLQTTQPQIVMLAAAVSDYLVSNYTGQKIRSGNSLNIQLTAAPKIIHAAREWAPDAFLVGFKLLIEADDKELVQAASDILQKHNLDLVIANNLSSIQRGAHEVILVERDGSSVKVTEKLAETIMARLVKR